MGSQSKIRYGVAMSLDGFIAGPNGDADWITPDPSINFAELWAQFDTLLMGRRTFHAAIARLGTSAFQGCRVVVASRTLRPADHPAFTVLPELNKDHLHRLREEGVKDIWLMGGGELASAVLCLDGIDTIEVNIIPVLLGTGTPLLPQLPCRPALSLLTHTVYPSGIVRLEYAVQRQRH